MSRSFCHLRCRVFTKKWVDIASHCFQLPASYIVELVSRSFFASRWSSTGMVGSKIHVSDTQYSASKQYIIVIKNTKSILLLPLFLKYTSMELFKGKSEMFYHVHKIKWTEALQFAYYLLSSCFKLTMVMHFVFKYLSVAYCN